MLGETHVEDEVVEVAVAIDEVGRIKAVADQRQRKERRERDYVQRI